MFVLCIVIFLLDSWTSKWSCRSNRSPSALDEEIDDDTSVLSRQTMKTIDYRNGDPEETMILWGKRERNQDIRQKIISIEFCFVSMCMFIV